MANESTLTTGFQYTNTTESETKAVTLYNMGETTNYALVEDEPTKVVLDNITAPVNASELLQYRAKRVNSVNTKLSLPAKSDVTQKAVQYAIQLDGDIVTTDSADATFRHDDPVIMYVTVIHPLSPYITDTLLGQHFSRLVSAMQKEDGSWRFKEIMRSALKPTSD